MSRSDVPGWIWTCKPEVLDSRLFITELCINPLIQPMVSSFCTIIFSRLWSRRIVFLNFENAFFCPLVFRLPRSDDFSSRCLYEKVSDASASRDQLHVWTNYPSNKRTDRLPSVILPVSPMQCYLEKKKKTTTNIHRL